MGDGYRGLTKLAAFQPDLVIIDLLMPGTEGMETIHELRRRQPRQSLRVTPGLPHSRNRLGAKACTEKLRTT